MDRATCRGYVSLKCEDPQQNRFSIASYNNAIDLAQQQFCIDARAIVKETTLTTTSVVTGPSTVSLPTDFLVAVIVRFQGLKLAPITRLELSFQNGQDWTTLPAGIPQGYDIDSQNQNIELIPGVDAGDAGNNLILDYIAMPPALSADTGNGGNLMNGLTILQYYTPAIINWAAREMLTYVPQTPEIMQKRAEFLKEYERYKSQCIETYANMADEPIRMGGGQHWQDNVIRPRSDPFSEF